MRKYILIITSILMATGVSHLNAQGYKGVIYFHSGEMKEINDTLSVAINMEIRHKSVQSYAGMNITPVILSGDSIVELPTMFITGYNQHKTTSRWIKLMNKEEKKTFEAPQMIVNVDQFTDTTINYNFKIPYELWMDTARMIVKQELVDYRDERGLTIFSMGGKVQLAPRTPYEVNPLVSMFEPEKEIKNRKKQGQAFIDFQVGRSAIVPNFRRNPEELAKIKDAFDEVSNNKDVNITGLFIEGYASPEGKYEMNDKLAKERSYALADYMSQNFRLPFSREQIKVEWTAEDWEGLKVLVQASEIQHKDQILAVIESSDAPDTKEYKLRSIGGGLPYRTMLKDMFPQLRRVEYQIDYTVKDYSVDETKTLIGKNNDLLSQRELYLAAISYDKDSKEYSDIILEVIPKLYSENSTAMINAAALMIEKGEYATARRVLEKFETDPRAWNNLGVIHLNQGDLDAALDVFSKALKEGSKEAEHNIIEVEKKKEDNVKMERYRNR